jgi:hypothetical protein
VEGRADDRVEQVDQGRVRADHLLVAAAGPLHHLDEALEGVEHELHFQVLHSLQRHAVLRLVHHKVRREGHHVHVRGVDQRLDAQHLLAGQVVALAERLEHLVGLLRVHELLALLLRQRLEVHFRDLLAQANGFLTEQQPLAKVLHEVVVFVVEVDPVHDRVLHHDVSVQRHLLQQL